MSTYLLAPGAGGQAWFWHRLTPLLEARGHTVVAPDVDMADPRRGLADFTADLVAAGHDAEDVVLVAQSLAGFYAPQAVAHLDVRLLVLLCPMIPVPGETPGAWGENTGAEEARRAFAVQEGRDPDAPFDTREVFFHDVPDDVTEAAFAGGDTADVADTSFAEPFPLDAWPDVPTAVIAGARDRLFPPDLIRRLARERVGADTITVDAGHCAALAQPAQLADALEAARAAAPQRRVPH